MLALAALAVAAQPAVADTILVSNEKGNSITVLDGASLKVIKTEIGRASCRERV